MGRRPRRFESWLAWFFPGGRHFFPILKTVGGFLYPHEAALLFQLAKKAPHDRTIVEIGSLEGRSTLCLAAGLAARFPRPPIVTIDPHLNRTETTLRKNLDRFRATDLVEVLVSRAEEAVPGWERPISLLFIDGAHDIAHVMTDFHSWFPHITPGGFLLLHDSTPLSRHPGPEFLAKTKLVVGEDFDVVGQIGSITWGRKRGKPDSWHPRLRGAKSLDRLLLFWKGKSGAVGPCLG